jgi:hypothetical protein
MGTKEVEVSHRYLAAEERVRFFLTIRVADEPDTRPRITTYREGRALEALGHAIDYLADELFNEKGIPSANDERVQAIQILMALNRQIYYSCPVKPTFVEKIRAFIHRLVS